MKTAAIAFLREVLKDGPVCTGGIAAKAKEHDIKWRTLRRASNELGLIKRPGGDLRWCWALPNMGLLSNASQACANAVVLTDHLNAAAPTSASSSTREQWQTFLMSKQQPVQSAVSK